MMTLYKIKNEINVNLQSPRGGELLKKIICGGSTPRSQPLPFHVAFLGEKKMVPLSHTCRKFTTFFSIFYLHNPLEYLNETTVWWVRLRYFEIRAF